MYKTTKNHPWLKEGLEVVKIVDEEFLGRPDDLFFKKVEDEDGIEYGEAGNLKDNPDWFEEVKWKPEEGSWYYYIDSDLIVEENFFCDGSGLDGLHKKAGNCFRTREEAEDKLKKILEILK